MSRTPREMEPYSPVSDRRRRQHRCLLQPSLSVARVLVRGCHTWIRALDGNSMASLLRRTSKEDAK
uniref:Uncharacterized protein n=1 Tax=Aegilops tauschii TaxID=37682 RepID=M8BWP5_AEGTA